MYIYLTLASNQPTLLYYGLFILLLNLNILKIILFGKKIKYRFEYVDLIPLTYFLVWVYGLVLGLINRNQTEFIIRNFAGMVTYLVYYLFLINKDKMDKEKLFNILYIASVLVMLQTILLSLMRDLLSINIQNPIMKALFGKIIGGSSTGHSRIYYPGQVSIFTILAVTLSRIIAPGAHFWKVKSRKLISQLCQTRSLGKAVLLLILASYAVLFVPASKGYYLAAIVLLLILPVRLLYARNKIRLNAGTFTYILFIVCGAIVIIALGYYTLITSIFATEDVANVARYEQIIYLINDTTFFGKGLGAVIPGYSRNSEFSYGFEISYLNLFHKFGIFAVLLIFCYCYSFYKASQGLTRNNKNIKYSAMSIGALSFVFPSLGNPILFNPQIVLLHCLALLLIRKRY